MARPGTPILAAAGLALMLVAASGGCHELSEVLSVSHAAAGELAPGYYWAELVEGGLLLFEMPRACGDPGRWVERLMARPQWFTGPGLYLLDESGQWGAVSDSPGQTLDAWLQVWDVGPAGPDDVGP